VDQPTGRRLSYAQRREQLLDSVSTLAADTDVEALSVQELAAHAGVSEGLLYHYFPTKQALILAAVSRAAESLMDDLKAATTSDGPTEVRLFAGLAAYLDHVQAQPVGWRAALRARTGELAAISAEVEALTIGLILDALDVQSPSDAFLLALSAWSAFEREACLNWLDHPGITRQAIEDLLLSSFDSALEAAGRHDPATAQVLARLAGKSGEPTA
jgi:AcrR family transcriptional regulator